MEMKRVLAAASAAVLALSGIASILVLNHQPGSVEAVELYDQDDAPAIRRQDDDAKALEAVPDDLDDDTTGGTGDVTGDVTDDAADMNAASGDGDDTRGDDGTSGGNNTGDGDDTRGDDGTSGGNNTGDNSTDNSVSNSND